jgi:hypothetical protein
MKRAHQALLTKRSHPALRKERASPNSAKSHQTASTQASTMPSQTKKTTQAKKASHPMEPIAVRLIPRSPMSTAIGQSGASTCRKARDIKQKSKTHQRNPRPK